MRSIWPIGLTCAACCGVCWAVTSGRQELPDLPGKAMLPLAQSLIALDSNEGRRQLWESMAKEGYIPLSMYFTTQENQAYCSVATGTMVLNSLPISRPRSDGNGIYGFFTQDNFFTPSVCRIVSREKVSRSGMTLQQMAETLRTFQVDIDITYAAEGSLDKFRATAIQTLRHRHSFMVVNYLRSAISQESGGHISPIAAYHEGTDRLLILDVARYKYPPVWVRVEALWSAMLAVDTESQKSRGYLVVHVGPGH
jgi:glutathione-S-conjugate glycine hydrolase